MRFEEMIRQQELEKQQREDGARRLEIFLNKITSPEILDESNSFQDLLIKMDYEQFIASIERINGILKEIPTSERESFKGNAAVIGSFMMSDTSEIVPPKKETREQIMHEVFDKLKQLVSSENQDQKSLVPFLAFNSIIYLHPFNDGNGRTARTVYNLLSSQNIESIKGKLAEAIKNRSEGLKEYHEHINFFIFQCMLEEKGIDWQDHSSEEKSVWPYLKDENPGVGFDKSYLGFLAAYDAMDENERAKYLKIGNNNEHSVDISEMPEDILSRIELEKEKIREEFVRMVIDLSYEPQGYFKELAIKLQEAIG